MPIATGARAVVGCGIRSLSPGPGARPVASPAASRPLPRAPERISVTRPLSDDAPVRTVHSFDASTGVPPQVGPFAHATRWGDTLYVTGQMPTDPATGALVGGGPVAETRQVLANLTAVLAHFGATLDDALMVRVYLTDFGDFDRFNAEYRSWFHGPLPSRTCVGVTGLAVGATVEIDLVVGIPGGGTR
nr:Rid family hydrolase [Clavibacter sp. VKM Ac-2873]